MRGSSTTTLSTRHPARVRQREETPLHDATEFERLGRRSDAPRWWSPAAVRRRALAAIALGWAAASVIPAAEAQSPSFVGQWHWIRGESTTTLTAPPRYVLLNITAAAPDRVEWTMTGTDAQGQKHVHAFIGTGNGTPAPVRGAPDGTTAAFTVTSSSMSAAYANRDGSGERTSCSLTPDRNRMICEGNESDGKGHTTSFRDVYDRL
jgi:hypothetical protein